MKTQNTEHKEGKYPFVRKQIAWSRGTLLRMYANQMKVGVFRFQKM